MDLKTMKQIIKAGDEDFISYIRELLDGNHIEGNAARGSALQLVDPKGNKLTDSQIETLAKYGILNGNYQEGCDMCANTPPWSEMYDVVHVDGLCSHCRHQLGK
ncbi:hypothetical protein [Bhargavaea beijingensis]|uniref:Uncharacterized protein n=1 Tax=Bhargavaea beijingensis TaxID=426756 RepID=A0ABX9ZC58_9BACL|nr:hypothetical protein [Bhargavaea beijingensis]RSK30960.1 hypothetical protein EJA12_09595 [Bhargavaea beijingensis]